jgi:hypothetical protein
MRKSWVQLYAPFLVLMIVQALFVAVAPSRGPQATTQVAADQSNGNGGGSLGGVSADGGSTDAGTSTDGSTAGGSTSGGATSSGGGGGGVSSAGSTTHCKDGQQFKLVLNNPAPCVPKFSGDNGGATYQGVTAKEIKVVRFRAQPNEQVDAILGAKGLVATDEQDKAAQAAFISFVNKHYEFYGRKLVVEDVIGDCPTTPPDYDKCNAAAQEVVKRKPALIVWSTSLYASVFDIWTKAGIPSFGGAAFDASYFNNRRPYRYDTSMDGTQAADHIAEYYCKKMAKKNADHSGAVIHSRIGARGQVARKLGIVVPEIEANVLTAKRVQEKVKGCGGGDSPVFTYESDIQRATEQTQATVAGLIENKVTTVVCMCDPIAPAFLTKGMTGNSYFPEFLLPGLGLLDYDLLGQLYEPSQMAHAFGPSHLGQVTNLDATDAALVWRAEGNSGHPCGNNGCGINWSNVNAVAIAIQMAGPNFNPLNLEKGMLNRPATGGWEPKHNPLEVFYKYGANDYTGVSDVREVYWSSTATSPVDGSRGAYLATDGGRRYNLGSWPSNGLGAIPVAAS